MHVSIMQHIEATIGKDDFPVVQFDIVFLKKRPWNYFLFDMGPRTVHFSSGISAASCRL